MDPSQMYSGAEHSPYWWAAFLAIAMLTTVGLMGMLLIGIGRAYRAPEAKVPAPETPAAGKPVAPASGAPHPA